MIYTVDLLPILVSLLFLSLVVLWVAVRNYKNFLITFIIIPLTLISVITSYTTIQNLLGYPVNTTIPDDSFYITHLESLDREWIYVWAVPPASDKPRAYTIANTEQNREAMEEAEAGAEDGVGQQIGSAQKGQGQTEGGEYVVYDFIPPDAENLKGE
jgi:hypothetical protein